MRQRVRDAVISATVTTALQLQYTRIIYRIVIRCLTCQWKNGDFLDDIMWPNDTRHSQQSPKARKLNFLYKLVYMSTVQRPFMTGWLLVRLTGTSQVAQAHYWRQPSWSQSLTMHCDGYLVPRQSRQIMISWENVVQWFSKCFYETQCY